MTPTIDHTANSKEENKKLLENYIERLAPFAEHSIDAYSPELVKPYAPYLVFDWSLRLSVRNLKREEYLSILKQTSPETAYSSESFPSLINIEKSYFNGLNLVADKSREEVSKFLLASWDNLYFPNLSYLSLFMENGKEFRDFLSFSGLEHNNLARLTIFDVVHVMNIYLNPPENLFSDSLLSQYLQKTGKQDIDETINECNTLCQHLQKMQQFLKKRKENNNDKEHSDAESNLVSSLKELRKKLYSNLSKNNPTLSAEYLDKLVIKQ